MGPFLRPGQRGDSRDRNRSGDGVEEDVLWIKHPVGYEVLYEFVDDSNQCRSEDG